MVAALFIFYLKWQQGYGKRTILFKSHPVIFLTNFSSLSCNSVSTFEIKNKKKRRN
jgi:hypothetical protein